MTCNMCSIIDVQVIIAIHLQSFKLEQKLLYDRFCLEGDDTVLVPLVPAVQHHAVHCLGDVGHEVAVLALRADLTDRV